MSTQVDFYILNSDDDKSRMTTLCRLADKVQRMGHRIFVLTADPDQSKLLDDLMWTFSQSSFLPHTMVNGDQAQADQTPVLIHHQFPDHTPQVLINLKDTIPDTHNIERIVEIINQNDHIKSTGRSKYRDYKNQQTSVKTHNIAA